MSQSLTLKQLSMWKLIVSNRTDCKSPCNMISTEFALIIVELPPELLRRQNWSLDMFTKGNNKRRDIDREAKQTGDWLKPSRAEQKEHLQEKEQTGRPAGILHGQQLLDWSTIFDLLTAELNGETCCLTCDCGRIKPWLGCHFSLCTYMCKRQYVEVITLFAVHSGSFKRIRLIVSKVIVLGGLSVKWRWPFNSERHVVNNFIQIWN